MEEEIRVKEAEIEEHPIKEIDPNMHEVIKSVCKICYQEGTDIVYGTGFFIKLYKGEEELLCLLTNEHVIPKYMIEAKEIINVYYNFEKNWIKIQLDKDKRFIKCNSKIDATIIGIIPEDKIKQKYFLIPNTTTTDFINKEIYIVQFPGGNKLSSSYGKVINIIDFDLVYNASTLPGSSGSPVILKNTTKVIGLHKEGGKGKNFGTLISSVIDWLEDNNKYNTLDKTFIHLLNKKPSNNSICSTRINFSAKPLIGLRNIGATCYMNTTLQILCNIEKFVDFFKYSKQINQIIENDTKNEKLSTSFKILIENLYPNDFKNGKSTYAPRDFKEKISKMNPLFQGIAANDAKDLVNFLIITLHNELNKAPKYQIENNNDIMPLNRSDKNTMFLNFAKEFTKTNQSIISDLFYASNYNMTQCCGCNAISYNYQIYFFLIFPLEKVRQFKLMNNNGYYDFNNNNEVDIYDCFDYDNKMHLMSGNDAMYCNYCRQTCDSKMCTHLSTGPEILIIILNRGKGIEFNVKINFNLDLDLSNYIELQNTGTQYELFGVITHIGESGMGGHFIAYSKEYLSNQWLKFDDATVEAVKDFKSEVIDFALPYLLFYQKKK